VVVLARLKPCPFECLQDLGSGVLRAEYRDPSPSLRSRVRMTAKNEQRQVQKQVLRYAQDDNSWVRLNFIGDAEKFEKLEGQVRSGGDVGFVF
jgi:hypothetical protein